MSMLSDPPEPYEAEEDLAATKAIAAKHAGRAKPDLLAALDRAVLAARANRRTD
jgi:hypothetical protein